jgi:phenylalanyl-tRNA synthetase beta chain
VFLASGGNPREELRLGIALCGARSVLLDQGLIKDSLGPLHLKGIFEVLFERLGVRKYNFNTLQDTSVAISIEKEKVGCLNRLSKNVLESLDIKNKEVFVAELSLERLFSYVNLNKKFNRLAVYPGISRDISLILKEDIAIGDILAAIKEKGQPFLQEVKVIDYYKGKQIPLGFKGLTLTCLYRLRERTLTEAEINPVHSAISILLKDRFNAQIR